jgi:hypothetical protein
MFEDPMTDPYEEIKPTLYRVSFYRRGITGGGEFEREESPEAYGFLDAIEKALESAPSEFTKGEKLVQGFVEDDWSISYPWQARRDSWTGEWSIEINPNSFYEPRWSWAVD